MTIANSKGTIMLVIDGFGQGGIQQAYKVLIREYCRNFERVYLVILQSSELELKIENFPNFEVLRVDSRKLIDISNFIKFRKKIIDINPDIIIASIYRSQIWSALVKKNSTKLIWVEHNTYVNRTLVQWKVMKILVSRVNKLVGVSNDVSNMTESKLKKETTTIPNPITFNQQSFVKDLRDNDFIFVSRMTQQKNPDLMILSFANFLAKYNISSTLHVVGGGALLDSSIQLAKELSIFEHCIFYNWVEINKVQELMSKSKTLVSTSSIEGMSLVRLEALASGCCVVTTNTGGAHLFNYAKDLGFFIVNATAEDFSNAMFNSLNPKYWTSEMVEKRTRIIGEFSATKIAINLIA
jgi:glycosyltransferase involved in cell wall biosynthesis